MANIITAKELNGSHVGAIVKFQWAFPVNMVQATVRGMIRTVYHSEGRVDIGLASPDPEMGSGDIQEFENIHPNLHVEVDKK